MIKEREPALAKVSVVIQVILSLACFWLAWWGTKTFIKPVGGSLSDYKVVFLLIIPLWYILLDHFELGNMVRITMYSSLFVDYISAVGIGMALLLAAIVILDYNSISRLVLGIFGILSLLVLFSYKLAIYRIMKYLRGRGYNTRSVLIIADEDSSYFIDRLIETTDWGYRIWAIMSDSSNIKKKYDSDYMILPFNEEITEIIDGNTIDEVMYCKKNLEQDEIRNFIYACSEVGVIFRIQSEFLNVLNVRSKLTNFNSLSFFTFINTPGNYLALQVKLIFDYVFAALILVVSSPVIFLIILAIKLDDGGPVFFKQNRVGLNGRRFKCLKFRTMVPDAEKLKDELMSQNEQEGPVFKIREDPRITRVGHFLRKTSLDELPQFINVLRGEMSVVGPRPPIPSEVSQYERWQRRRLSMKPGITCIWQVSGRNNIPFDQWMVMDLQYIDGWSLKMDFIILLKTLKVIVTGDGQ